jgi:large subunit ribosomal protein L4
MAASAPVLDQAGAAARELTLGDDVFAAEIKPHLVHETVRAELNARRAGTRGAKSRGLVSGGRSKPWRQKGTGRARQGTIRAPHFTGGGLAFPPQPRKFDVKVNRKARKAALRAALTSHAGGGSLGVIAASGFDGGPSTKRAAGVLGAWGQELPALVVATAGEETLAKSFRNLARVLVVTPAEVEVAAIVWARSLLVSESALEELQKKAAL